MRYRYRLILSLCIARIVSTHLIALPSIGGTSVGMTKAVLWVVPRTQIREVQGCTNCCSLAAGLRGNGERMRNWRESGNGEREISSLSFLAALAALYLPPVNITPLILIHNPPHLDT